MSLTTGLHSQPEKSARRVRFSLPEAKLTFTTDSSKYRTLHGTKNYVNGTLINVTHSTTTTTGMKLNEIGKQNSKTELNGIFKSSLKNGNLPKDSSQYKMSISLRPTTTTASTTSHVKNTLPKTSSALANKKKLSKMKTKSEKSFKTLPNIDKKFSSLEDLNEESLNGKMPEFKSNLSRYKSTEDVRDPNNFKVSKNGNGNGNSNGNIPKLPATTTRIIIETAALDSDNNNTRRKDSQDTLNIESKSNGLNSTNINNRNHSENRNFLTVPTYQELIDQDFQDQQNGQYNSNNNSNENANNMEQFWDFLEKWKNNRKYCNRKIENIFKNSSVSSTCSIRADVKKSSSLLSARLKAFKMSLDQTPIVSKLLRASRDGNEILLKECFTEILEHGISPKDLNATDKSGRTALSYICSTNLTNFLELFLHLEGIDINKADNEGNSPLHFAAQSGQTEIVNILLSKSKGLSIDAKNNLGFTALMKAALQGRTKCAKLLLFAGASPIETDYGRGFRPDQWARFCGRHSCAEMIEQTARSKLLEKSTSNKWHHDSIPRSKTSPVTHNNNSNLIQQSSHSGGFRSKFRKVFPFGFSLKDKHKNAKNNNNTNGNTNASNGFVVINEKSDNTNSMSNSETISTDIVSYLTAATLCVSGPAITSHENKQMVKSLIRPLEVPKLEVTFANNAALIKKYENMPSHIDSSEPKSKSHKKTSKKSFISSFTKGANKNNGIVHTEAF